MGYILMVYLMVYLKVYLIKIKRKKGAFRLPNIIETKNATGIALKASYFTA